jgi:hypothetical protein
MKISVELKKASGQTQTVQVPAFLTKSSVAMQLLKQGRVGASPSIAQVTAKPKQARVSKPKLESSRV